MLLNMNLFEFRPTIQVVFGTNALAKLGDLVKSLGGRHVLIVTDAGIVASGITAKALNILHQSNISTNVFDDVHENPTDAQVKAAAAVVQSGGLPDVIIALGGGSSMDCAKGINFLVTNGGQMADYWGFGKATQPMLPSIGIPSTAGTGSEAQSFALISRATDHRKMACGDLKARFHTVILDPLLLATLPKPVAAVTVMDAFSHAVESFVSTKRTAFSQMFAKEAFRFIDEHAEYFLNSPSQITAASAMLMGAHLAGMSIENSMLGAAHALANPLTATYGITHGTAVGIMLPHVVRFNASEVAPLYGELILHSSVKSDAVTYLTNRIHQLQEWGDLPGSLNQCNVPETDLPVLAKLAAEQWTGRFNPRPVDEQTLLDLYRQAW
ncbi:MAG: iron-containing alcohol dehydrogenase [Calditrichia bacterium]